MKIPLTISLFLPVLFPSWRFFSGIGPSPRIDYAILQHKNDTPRIWQEFRPKPQRISFGETIRRLFWNPKWNETLYINSCAERLFAEYSPMREQEMMRRIVKEVRAQHIAEESSTRFLVFRIHAVIRDHHTVTQTLLFTSQPALLDGVTL